MQQVLILGARTAFGFLLSIVLGMAAIAIAWGFFIFFGSTSAGLWLVMQLIASGAGAGTGGFLAWLKIDHYTMQRSALIMAVAVAAGVVGAYAGYEFGAYQSAICCDKPGSSIMPRPVVFSVTGAAIGTTMIMLLLELVGGKIIDKRAERPF